MKNVNYKDFLAKLSAASAFSKAWLKAMHPSNITSRSISTGVYPFDRAAICVPGLEKENKDTESFAISSGLAYIPLYIVRHCITAIFC